MHLTLQQIFKYYINCNIRIIRSSKMSSHNIIQDNLTVVDGYTVNHTVIGYGKHTVLLLPGAMGTMQSDFAPQFKGLDKERYTLISWDPIGYGKSRPPQREFIPDFYVNDAKVVGKLMEKLNRQQYSVVGWSDGAITAIILAALRPENMRRAVLLAPMAYVTKEDVQIYQGLKDISQWTEAVQLRQNLEAVYGAKYLEELWTSYCKYFEELLAHREGEVCRKFLPAVKCPTLVLHGQKDPVVPLHHGEFVARNISAAEFHVIENGKHNFHYDFSDKINSMIDEFLSRPEDFGATGDNYGWYQWKPPSHCWGKYSWRKNAPGFIPPRALPVGRDKDGSPLYAGRAQHQGDLLPAKVRADGKTAYVPYNGVEYAVHQFEILASYHIAWQYSHDGEINDQAMIIGHTVSGENLYMGRAFYDGTITPGKVHPTHKTLYIPYNGKEISIKEYEIMLLL